MMLYLNKVVVDRQVGLVESTGHGIIGEELPSNRETESIETVVIDEVLHLAFTIVTW